MIDDGMPVGDPKDRQITALRAEVERFKVSLSDAVRQTQEQADDITALRAENERLRAALHDVLGWHDYSNDMHKPIEVRAAYMRARAALEEKP